MKFWCSICNKAIENGSVIFICEGSSWEPVPDSHKRLKAMHKGCAEQLGLTIQNKIYEE